MLGSGRLGTSATGTLVRASPTSVTTRRRRAWATCRCSNSRPSRARSSPAPRRTRCHHRPRLSFARTPSSHGSEGKRSDKQAMTRGSIATRHGSMARQGDRHGPARGRPGGAARARGGDRRGVPREVRTGRRADPGGVRLDRHAPPLRRLRLRGGRQPRRREAVGEEEARVDPSPNRRPVPACRTAGRWGAETSLRVRGAGGVEKATNQLSVVLLTR